MLVGWFTVAWSQAYEGWPCRPKVDLAAELAAGEVRSLSVVGPALQLVAASSLLPPSSSARPDLAAARRVAEAARVELGGEDGLALVAADLLACTYGPTRLLDGDPATAWCEGAKGPGVGEVVVVPLPGSGPLEIRDGYGKSPELFAQNARVRRVEVALLGSGWEAPAQYTVVAATPVLGRREVELKDVDGWQELPLPEWSAPTGWAPSLPAGWTVPPQTPRFVAMRILSVYPGTKYEDTCVSEIRRRP